MAEYIEREAAKRIVDNIDTWSSGWRDYAKLQMDSLPAADVAPVRHGRWKSFDLTWGRSVYACTACGDAFGVPTEYMGEPMYAYCPYCGARMDVPDTDVGEMGGDNDG